MDSKFVVNVPYANVYNNFQEEEVVSQALMGETVRVIEEVNNHAKIVLSDSYQGFLRKDYLLSTTLDGKPIVVIKEPVVNAYRDPSIRSKLIFSLPIGSVLLDNEFEEGDYRNVSDFAGRSFFVHKNAIFTARFPFTYKKTNCKEIVRTSLMFLNVPYLWGGKTSFGFDCSGFVQTVFKLNGYYLLRDAHMQASMDIFEKYNFGEREILPCDVLFFGKEKINHVGIYIGHRKFIHATTYNVPKVQISDFSKYWIDIINVIGRIKW
ncbi:MAG: C40 family peptidase [Candidatus Micrarchaeia archaeon]